MSRKLTLLLALMPGLFAQTPHLAWSSLIDRGNEEIAQVTIPDRDGGVWVAGVSSSNFEVTGPNDPFQAKRVGELDIYIAKYRPEANGGTTLLFWTWLGGDADDIVTAMTLGADGRLYLTGYTSSANFPLAGEAFQTTLGGGATTFSGADAFIAVVDPTKPNLESLVFSSYYGGSGEDRSNAIDLAPDGTIVIVGETQSGDLPNIKDAGRILEVNLGGTDAFVARCNMSSVLYATYYGGEFTDGATGVQVDSNNRIWFSGWTASHNFPVTADALQGGLSVWFDGFLVQINTDASGLDGLVYATFIGGAGTDVSTALKFDEAGGLWMGGYTTSGDFPVSANAYQPGYSGFTDSFLVRFNTAGTPSIAYSTFFGGPGHELLYSIAPGRDGRVAFTGYVMYGGLPTTTGALQPLPSSGFTDGFITVIQTGATPSSLAYSSYIGAEYDDVVTSIAADEAGMLYVAGYTYSRNFPVTDGSQKTNPPRLPSGLLQKIRP